MMRFSLLALVLACGKGPACPRLSSDATTKSAPPACPKPAAAECAHHRREHPPRRPASVADPAIDAIRLDDYARRPEVWSTMEWFACGGAE